MVSGRPLFSGLGRKWSVSGNKIGPARKGPIASELRLSW